MSNFYFVDLDQTSDLKTQIEAGKKILEHGAENVLIKGGHSKSEIIHDCLIQ